MEGEEGRRERDRERGIEGGRERERRYEDIYRLRAADNRNVMLHRSEATFSSK